MKNFNLQKGFTLIEAIIFIAIFSVMLVGMVQISLNALTARNKNFVASEVHQNARFALDIISQKIRSCNGFSGVSTFDANPGVLSMSNVSGALTPTVFDVDPTTQGLRMTEGVSSPVILTTGNVRVTKLIFQNATGTSSKKNIRIKMTLSYANPSDPQFSYSYDFQTTVSMRQ